jgi:hypothetical protein
MLMLNGDSCGGSNGDRQVKLKLKCQNDQNQSSDNEELFSVDSINEPLTCKYEITLRTRFVCDMNEGGQNVMSQQMNVYLNLNDTPKLQHEWDMLESQYKMNLITKKVEIVFSFTSFSNLT